MLQNKRYFILSNNKERVHQQGHAQWVKEVGEAQIDFKRRPKTGADLLPATQDCPPKTPILIKKTHEILQKLDLYLEDPCPNKSNKGNKTQSWRCSATKKDLQEPQMIESKETVQEIPRNLLRKEAVDHGQARGAQAQAGEMDKDLNLDRKADQEEWWEIMARSRDNLIGMVIHYNQHKMKMILGLNHRLNHLKQKTVWGLHQEGHHQLRVIEIDSSDLGIQNEVIAQEGWEMIVHQSKTLEVTEEEDKLKVFKIRTNT